MLGKIVRFLHQMWIEPFRIDKLKVKPLEEGTETSGEPEDVFKHGDWVVLGFIEPTKPMDWDDFTFELYFESEPILEKAFSILKKKLEERGYEIERAYKPLFYAESPKPRVWYIVKKRGKPIAYCDLVIPEPEYSEEPYAELVTVCMNVPKKPK